MRRFFLTMLLLAPLTDLVAQEIPLPTRGSEVLLKAPVISWTRTEIPWIVGSVISLKAGNTLPPSDVSDVYSGSAQNRIVKQFLGGLLASGAAVAGTVVIASVLPFNDESGRLESGEVVLFFGVPLVFIASNSCTVYAIGEHFDKSAHGKYWDTLGGTLAGLLTSAMSMIFLEPNDAFGVIVGLSSVCVFSTVGSVAGYNLSRSKASAALNIQGKHIQWGIPVPAVNVSRLSNSHVEGNYTLRLVNVRF